MSININSLNAELIYNYLDKSEGGNKVGDNRLGANAWNKFIDSTGVKGSKISYSIFKNRTENSYGAIVSLTSYLRRADETTKQKIVDYLNTIEEDFDNESKAVKDEVKVSVKTEQQNSQQQKSITPSAKKPAVTTPQMKPAVKPNSTNKQTKATKFFSEHTLKMNSLKFEHTTELLNVAQDSLGIREVSAHDFERMTDEEKARTQYAMIGSFGNITDQWCAHTVSTLCAKAGVDIGYHKASVQQFINWANNRGTYHPITSSTMNSANIYNERANRSSQLNKQLSTMHEGDFIIMKNQYVARTPNAGDVTQKASHIMIVEKVDVQNGRITVIEGNANENIYVNSERVLVQNSAEGRNGRQVVGEFQEVNESDGLIRKEYTIEELAANGYSGYIDNSEIV